MPFLTPLSPTGHHRAGHVAPSFLPDTCFAGRAQGRTLERKLQGEEGDQGDLHPLLLTNVHGSAGAAPGLCETYVYLQHGDIRGQELIHALWTLTAA